MMNDRGFSRIDALACLCCTVVLGSIVVSCAQDDPEAGSAASAADSRAASTADPGLVQAQLESAQRKAAEVLDQKKLRGIHQGMMAFAASNEDRLPSPSFVRRHPVMIDGRPVLLQGRGDPDWSRNTTANLYSLMVMDRWIAPEHLISPLEVNEHVSTYDAYNYNAYDPTAGVFWDPELKCDLDGVAHASYAHTALCGERRAKQWVLAAKNNAPVLCLRGPAAHRDSDEAFTKSPTLLFMEPHDEWVGNVVFADGHVERHLESFKMHAGTYDQFFETSDPASNDLWLGIYVAASENDATPIFDPLRE